MTFTDTQLEILYNSWLLARDGNGQVLEDHAITDADQLAEHGWLERRTEPNGDTSWWWTPQAETALDTTALVQSTEGREN
jgi:hypothetical protein